MHRLSVLDIGIELLFFLRHALLIEFKLTLLDLDLLEHYITALVHQLLQRTGNSTTTTTTTTITISGNARLLLLVVVSTFLQFLLTRFHSQGGTSNNFSSSCLFFLDGGSSLLVTVFGFQERVVLFIDFFNSKLNLAWFLFIITTTVKWNRLFLSPANFM
jgi:hypothetical protein